MNKTAYTVSQITRYIKDLIDEDEVLSNVYIKGEISNYKVHSSGHVYFTLKDDESKIKCILFKSYSSRLKFIPEDGMSVFAYGSISIYERDGQYQLYCTKLEPDGFGSLYLAYEQLKEKLAKEGLFSDEYKKPLPMFPRKIGVVTSSTGAVIRDIINVSTRRFSGIKILLYPAKVQGEGAAESIVEGIRYFNTRDDIDVIIIGRGGGSIEELWAFNEEIVVRAIFESKVPIISAVGHETDITISDFVADVRASTPSHAAEIAVPKFEELKFKITNCHEALYKSLINNIRHRVLIIESLQQRIMNYSPNNIIIQNIQYIDNLHSKIINIINKRITYEKNKSQMLCSKLDILGTNILSIRRNKFLYLVGKIDALSPLKILSRGYAFVEKEKEIIKSINDIEIDDILMLQVSDGSVKCRVEEKLEVNLWEMN
ncbi:Exodeoxyribonuclease 7 large subunit [Caloramator mitchellensis]|uniref:Exodeoxyribonuclease 7 large subunit n=1 Tax=Caloramator mitchellensis TaxID=908809 RepID=A0A0R3JWV3_CALMK|nr:exodeoxyribonuclease VII large subunit [Caloramator mitchellensis]KRQ86829.1 Exodeoxyribonuclease 7 large subunit [Caloramator mitchellensis]